MNIESLAVELIQVQDRIYTRERMNIKPPEPMSVSPDCSCSEVFVTTL